jgi:hypothetical protein
MRERASERRSILHAKNSKPSHLLLLLLLLLRPSCSLQE